MHIMLCEAQEITPSDYLSNSKVGLLGIPSAGPGSSYWHVGRLKMV